MKSIFSVLGLRTRVEKGRILYACVRACACTVILRVIVCARARAMSVRVMRLIKSVRARSEHSRVTR